MRLSEAAKLTPQRSTDFAAFLVKRANGRLPVEVCRLFAAGETGRAEDLFDTHLPLDRHEQQPGFGLAPCKEVLRRRGIIACARARKPGPILTARDRAELDHLMARLQRKL